MIDEHDQWEYFDDCPICQVMKEGKNSMAELKEAFKKAEEQGGIVGGEVFEDE